MRFEITHENGQKEIKEFHGEKAVVGSGDNADIKIFGEHIAKNQIILEKIEGKIYVTDLDNENGTYINDELIEPHKRIEFLSFFPIQIGPKVFIHLLPDEDQKPEPVAVASKPLTDFEFAQPAPKKASPKKAQPATKEGNPKKLVSSKVAAKPASSNAQNQLAFILLGLSIALGIFIYQMGKEDLTPEAIAAMTDPQIALLADQHKEFSELFEKHLNSEKCRNEAEQLFCNFFNHPLQKDEGYLIDNGVLYLYLNLDRAVSTSMRDHHNTVPRADFFHFFLVNTIFNTRFLALLEEQKISHLNFVLFNVIEGKLTLTKYFSNSVDFILKHLALDDIRTSMAETEYQKDPVHLQDIIKPHLDWVDFK